MGYYQKFVHEMVWKVVETPPHKTRRGMAAITVRSVTGHVKINAIEVVNTLGKAAFTENTGTGISRYSLSCGGLCVSPSAAAFLKRWAPVFCMRHCYVF
jgi:hypothetical protein